MRNLRGAVGVSLAIFSTACIPANEAVSTDGGDGGVDPVDAGPCWIAVTGDFLGYEQWQSFDGGSDDIDSLDGGQRTLYLNQAPPHGSDKFPQGTIVVKTTEGAVTFAMAKRGCGFNPYVDNWEWFGLNDVGDGGVEILWRGLGPSSTLGYGATQPTGCTGCHLMYGYQNDFVAGSSVQLSQF